MKKILALILALIMVFSLVACGAKEEPKQEEKPAESTTEKAPEEKPAEPEKAPEEKPAEPEKAPEEKPAEEAKGGTLKVGIPAVITDLGVPAKGLVFQGALIADSALEHLCRYNEDGTLKPWLCTAYEEDADAMTLTVHLREGVKFHDGSDFNAEAVVWNWELWTECGNAELKGVTEYEIVDDHTVVIHLGEWSNSIATSALYTAGAMISMEYAKANGIDAANMNPVGTGPFKFVEWVADEKVTFVANEEYWIEGKPYLDGVEFYTITDSATLTSAFLAKEIDIIANAPNDASMTLKANGFESQTKPLVSGASSTIIFYSCQHDGPVGNVDVRRAIASAIDVDAIWAYCSSQTGAIYDRTIQWGPNNVWSVNPETKGYPYDVEAAKAYLAAAGYPDGFEMSILYDANVEESANIAVLVQDYLAQVGIKGNIEGIEMARLNEISGMEGEPFNGIIINAGRAEVDLTVYYNRTFLPDGVRWVNQVNHDADIVENLQNAMSCKTFEEKQKYCQTLSKLVIDEYCSLLPMWTVSGAVFAQDYVSNHGMYQINMIIWTPEEVQLAK